MFPKHYVHSHLGLVLRNIKPMKHNLQDLLIFFLVSVIFLSCGILTKGYNDYKSAKFIYKEHDYHQATIYASKSLKLNSKNKMALNLFEKSYPSAVEQHKSNIIKLENIDDDSKWPELYYVYAQLQNLSDEITSLQSIIKLENILSFQIRKRS